MPESSASKSLTATLATAVATALAAVLVAAPVVAQVAPTPAASGSAPTPAGGAAPSLRVTPSTQTVTRAARRTDTRAPQAGDYIVALVNSDPITNHEVRTRLARAERQLDAQGDTSSRDDRLRRVLDLLIEERAQVALAKEQGMRIEDSLVEQAEQTVAAQNQMTVPTLHERLRADGMPLAIFRDNLRNQLMVQRLRERELESRVRMTEAEVDQAVLDMRSQRVVVEPAQGELAQVLIEVPENATAAQRNALRERAETVARRARSGEDFAALVREFSDGDRSNGGSLGLRPAERLPELFVRATDQTPAGGVAGPVQSGAGWHIIKVLQRVEEKTESVGTTVAQTRARHILLRASPRLSEAAARERLADLRRRIDRGEDFAALARELSQDPSAASGGELGWVSPGQFVPEFEAVMDTLDINQISPPVASRFGLHLIQVLERRDAPLSEREQRNLARAALRERKIEQAYTAWAQEVRGRAWVELREPPQ